MAYKRKPRRREGERARPNIVTGLLVDKSFLHELNGEKPTVDESDKTNVEEQGSEPEELKTPESEPTRMPRALVPLPGKQEPVGLPARLMNDPDMVVPGRLPPDVEPDLYAKAVYAVRAARGCSVPILQGRLNVGPKMAYRLIQILQANGVVGPPVGGNLVREVTGVTDVTSSSALEERLRPLVPSVVEEAITGGKVPVSILTGTRRPRLSVRHGLAARTEPKKTEERMALILALLERDVPWRFIIKAVDVDQKTLARWIKTDDEFGNLCRVAMARAVDYPMAVIDAAIAAGNVEAAKWKLEHLHPETFNKGAQKQGMDGAKITLVLKSEAARPTPIAAPRQRTPLPPPLEREGVPDGYKQRLPWEPETEEVGEGVPDGSGEPENGGPGAEG